MTGQICQLCYKVRTGEYLCTVMTDLLQPDIGVHLDLDGGSLTIDEAVRLARHGGRATLSTEAVRRVEASRALKHDLIGREIPIYGVTTGFGDSAHRQIAPQKAAQLQQNMLRFLGCGTGPIASPEVTRATMLFRANCLAKGNSGVRMELIERLLTLLNHDILPLIPERGSCGASGDLVRCRMSAARWRARPRCSTRARSARRPTCWPSSGSSRSRSRPRKASR